MSLGPIVVALDGSDLAEQAVPVAAALACRTGAELHLVHVHVPLPRDPIHVEGLPVIDEQMRSRRRDHEQAYLDGARARLVADTPGLTRVIDGTPASAVAAYAHGCGAQLVVLTTHGRGGLERVWLGSVADELIRMSSVPVLVLRPEPRKTAGPLSRILVPLDGSPLAEGILEPAMRMARLEPGAEILLLQIVPPVLPAIVVPHALVVPAPPSEEVERAQRAVAAEYLDRVGARVRSAGLGVRTRVELSASVAGAILRVAVDERADLVALSTHGRSGIVRIALGSVADKIVRASTTPVLLFRPPTSSQG
jgi:nucleotide-binding universal stress UspA family protein